MKAICVFCLVIACIASASHAAEEKPRADAVVVKVLGTPLPPEQDKKAEFLWDQFANTPDEQKFNSYTTEKWKDTFTDFANALVNKAKNQELDTISLRKVLDLILKEAKDKLAYLPVGAYQTTLDGSLVWIVTVKWEYPPKDKKEKNCGLGHIRMFVFDQKSLQQVGFNSCM